LHYNFKIILWFTLLTGNYAAVAQETPVTHRNRQQCNETNKPNGSNAPRTENE